MLSKQPPKISTNKSHRASQSYSCHYHSWQYCFPGQQRDWSVATQVMLLWCEMELGYLFSPLCWEPSDGENSCPWESSVCGTPLPFLHHFLDDGNVRMQYSCQRRALLQPEQNWVFSRSLLGRNTIPPQIGERVTWKGDTIRKEKACPLIKRGYFITFFCLFLIMMSI